MKKFTLLSLITSSLSLLGGDIAPQPAHCHASHDHGNHYTPVGVMGGHMHSAGEWMLSYRYMFMNMQTNMNGTDDLSLMDVFSQGYMVAPVDMQMETHMIGAMYAPTDSITFMGMMNLVSMEMEHERSAMAQMMMGGPRRFSTSSAGWGDASLGALVKLYTGETHSLHAGVSVCLPTAETDKKDVIPGPGKTTLPYPMQLGSGSWGVKPSLTYLGHHAVFSWGAQVSAQLNLTENENGYKLGDSLTTNLWGAIQLTDALHTSLRLQSTAWTNIEGSHDTLLPLPVPTVDTSLKGGQKLNAFWGVGYAIPKTSAKVSAELGKTLWQDLDGPQLASDWSLILGVSAEF